MSAKGPEIDFPMGVPSICVNIRPSIVLKWVSRQIRKSLMMSSAFQSVLSASDSSFNNVFLVNSRAFSLVCLGSVQLHQAMLGCLVHQSSTKKNASLTHKNFQYKILLSEPADSIYLLEFRRFYRLDQVKVCTCSSESVHMLN